MPFTFSLACFFFFYSFSLNALLPLGDPAQQELVGALPPHGATLQLLHCKRNRTFSTDCFPCVLFVVCIVRYTLARVLSHSYSFPFLRNISPCPNLTSPFSPFLPVTPCHYSTWDVYFANNIANLVLIQTTACDKNHGIAEAWQYITTF